MHRPPKKKAKNPLLPDDDQIDSVDERNLIDVDESADISFEDKVRMYWMENKVFISGCITVLALVVIFFNGMRIYKEHAVSKLQSGYNEAAAAEDLESFARENANKDLGGFAALSEADSAFAGEDYEKAIELYDLAASALDDPFLSNRARLGQAFARYNSGAEEEALSAIQTIAADSAVPQSIRAEALYHLAVDADVGGASDRFESYAQELAALEQGGAWQQQMTRYQQQRR